MPSGTDFKYNFICRSIIVPAAAYRIILVYGNYFHFRAIREVNRSFNDDGVALYDSFICHVLFPSISNI